MNSRVITKFPVEDLSDEEAALVCGGMTSREDTATQTPRETIIVSPTTPILCRPEPDLPVAGCQYFYCNGQLHIRCV